MKFLDWFLVISSPFIAASFAYDIYAGTPANWSVWYFAFLGIAYTFIGSLKDLLLNNY